MRNLKITIQYNGINIVDGKNNLIPWYTGYNRKCHL